MALPSPPPHWPSMNLVSPLCLCPTDGPAHVAVLITALPDAGRRGICQSCQGCPVLLTSSCGWNRVVCRWYPLNLGKEKTTMKSQLTRTTLGAGTGRVSLSLERSLLCACDFCHRLTSQGHGRCIGTHGADLVSPSSCWFQGWKQAAGPGCRG